MAKKKMSELKSDILSDDYEIEETDIENITRIMLAKAIGRLASKP